MSHLSNGVTVDQDDWDDQDDRVTNLEDTVLTTGGTVNDATLSANIACKECSGTLSSTGSVTVTHNLGWTPRVFIQMRGNPNSSGPYVTYVSTVTNTTFIVFFGYITKPGSTPTWNAGASGQSVTFDAWCFKGDTF